MKRLAHTAAGLTAAAALATAAGVVVTAPADASTSSRVIWHRTKVVRWIDGDTVVTRAGTVRLIGVDTPEVGQVGYTTAKNSAARWAQVGHMVRLGNPVSVDNRDRYGRALRYVVSARGIDISRAEIRIGAKARYDGRDGYDWHPRQRVYRWVDVHHRDFHRRTTQHHHRYHHWVAGVDTRCPSGYPVKGNDNSMIYHVPGQTYYSITNARHCYAHPADAEHDGYRAAQI